MGFTRLPHNPTATLADPQVSQVSGWVKERSFALGSVSYVFGAWVLLREPLGMFILVSLHIFENQGPERLVTFPVSPSISVSSGIHK